MPPLLRVPLLALMAVAMAAPGVTAQSAPTDRGTWTINALDDGRLQLQLRWGSSTTGNPVGRAELRGLSDGQIAAPTATPVAFRLEREAGAFAFEGSFREGLGSGRFTFSPDRAFAAMLRSHGVEAGGRVTDRDLLTLALVDVTARYVAEMSAVWEALGVHDLVTLRAVGVTTAFLAGLRGHGYDGLTADEAVQLQAVGVDGAYVEAMARAGYRGLDASDLVALRALGVTPDYVRELGRHGLADVSASDLQALRGVGVTPAYIRELAEAGLTRLSGDDLVQLKALGVTAPYVRELRAAGYRDLTADRLVQLRALGAHGGDAPGRRQRAPRH